MSISLDQLIFNNSNYTREICRKLSIEFEKIGADDFVSNFLSQLSEKESIIERMEYEIEIMQYEIDNMANYDDISYELEHIRDDYEDLVRRYNELENDYNDLKYRMEELEK